jgi:hypothetical protein
MFMNLECCANIIYRYFGKAASDSCRAWEEGGGLCLV